MKKKEEKKINNKSLYSRISSVTNFYFVFLSTFIKNEKKKRRKRNFEIVALWKFHFKKIQMKKLSILLATIFASSFVIVVNSSKCKWSSGINLPPSHMVFYFNSNEKMRQKCLKDDTCPFKEAAEQAAENSTTKKCWGYEKNCKAENRLFLTQCPGDSGGWVYNNT